MNPKQVMQFCAPEDDPRDYLHHPFKQNGMVYATNGAMLIELFPKHYNDIVCEQEKPDCSFVDGVFDEIRDGDYLPIPEIAKPATRECTFCGGTGKSGVCSECGGLGYIVCDLGHEHDCEKCGGTGSIKGEDQDCIECSGSGEVFDNPAVLLTAHDGSLIHVDWRLLQKFKALPGVKYAIGRFARSELQESNVAAFVFDKGRGLLMPMYP